VYYQPTFTAKTAIRAAPPQWKWQWRKWMRTGVLSSMNAPDNATDHLICAVAPLDAILRLAEKVPVFPCRRDPETVVEQGRTRTYKSKSPLTERGFKDASQDPAKIRQWWKKWPEALVGVPTGTVTGFLAIDVDTHKLNAKSNAWIQEHTDVLLQTRAHSTMHNGKHYLFKLMEGAAFRCSVDTILNGEKRSGIDIRADGGYIIYWPMHGGSPFGEMIPLPDGLLDEGQRINTAPLEPLPETSTQSWQQDRPKLVHALPFVNPTSRDDWLRVGMALHLASTGSEDGFALWHLWSAGELTGETPRSYSGPQDCKFHWQSFKHDKERNKTVTIASIYKMAAEGGWGKKHDGEKLAAFPTPLVISASEFNKLDIPEREAIVEGLILTQTLIMLYAWRGLGKTMVSLALAVAVASGKPFLKWSVPVARRVLYVDGEMAASELQERLKKFCGNDVPMQLDVLASEFFYDTERESMNLAKAEHQQRFLAQLELLKAEERNPALIILDNKAALMSGVEENSSTEQEPFWNFMKVLRYYGYTVMIVHHAGKGGDQRGTSANEGLLNLVIQLEIPKSNKKNGEDADWIADSEGAAFRMTFPKKRGRRPTPHELDVELIEDFDGTFDWIMKVPKHKNNMVRVAEFIRDHHPRTRKEIATALDMAASNVSREIAKLREREILEQDEPLRIAPSGDRYMAKAAPRRDKS
jgi:DNA-binding transcriptional ArsR family regulator